MELQGALERFDREHERLYADALSRAEGLIGRYGPPRLSGVQAIGGELLDEPEAASGLDA